MLMNRLRQLVFFVFACVSSLNAQNLVSNPGLDIFLTCPGFGQFGNTFIVDWSKPTIASSDYYNFNCPAIVPTLEIPYNGEAYAGIIAYNFGTEYREYITGTLTSPLMAGNVYEVEFYVSLHNNYIQAIEELGAYLSVTPPGPFSNSLHIPVTPQIINTTGALDDTSGWKKISGIFVATGGEQYITIGNFNDDASTTVTQPYSIGSFGAYYFVDGVSVAPVAATAVNNITSNQQVSVYFGDGMLHINTGTTKVTELAIADITGRVVYKNQGEINGTITMSLNALSSGIYTARILTENKNTQVTKVILTTQQK